MEVLGARGAAGAAHRVDVGVMTLPGRPPRGAQQLYADEGPDELHPRRRERGAGEALHERQRQQDTKGDQQDTSREQTLGRERRHPEEYRNGAKPRQGDGRRGQNAAAERAATPGRPLSPQRSFDDAARVKTKP